MERTQREYYLNEQMKAIQKELGDGDERLRTMPAEYEEKIAETKLTKEAREKAEAELKKLRNMSPMSAEATVVRNYLDWMLSIPWGKRSRIKKDLGNAQMRSSTRDHYRAGEGQGADRRIPCRAVSVRRSCAGRSCALSAPRASARPRLGKSVAKATNREFIRISLGGGARRGRDPGPPADLYRVDAGQDHPVDEEGQDDQPADPARRDRQDGPGFPGRSGVSAMLEVLDPEQNNTFMDHYLEVEYDLSNVMFITTANSYNMPRTAAGPDGDHHALGLHRGREARDRQAASAVASS